MVIKPNITISKKEIPLTLQTNELSSKFRIHLEVCFNVIKGILHKCKCSVSFQWVFLIQNNPHGYFNHNLLPDILAETLPLQYQIDLDSDVNKKRITVDNSDQLENIFALTADIECAHINLQYLVRCFFVWFFFFPTQLVREVVSIHWAANYLLQK